MDASCECEISIKPLHESKIAFSMEFPHQGYTICLVSLPDDVEVHLDALTAWGHRLSSRNVVGPQDSCLLGLDLY